MAQWVEHLPCKPEDQSSGHQKPHSLQAGIVVHLQSQPQRVEARSRSKPASETSHTGKLGFGWEIWPLWYGGRAMEDEIQSISSKFLRTHAHTCTHALVGVAMKGKCST